jgi:DUF971 family protein
VEESGPLKPMKIRREGEERLIIEWSDQKTGIISWATLRAQCPCASCREERQKPPDPFHILSAREVAAGSPRPVSMTPVGHYAYKVVWNDGHDAGIYTIENLRELCSFGQDASTKSR